mmetsp:Transcript_8243/g.15209  ORF Transcript_8243/g.15209 Transcript_8243/m.15209 type:complete len:115 (+) Transcript_8243:237-581(+)
MKIPPLSLKFGTGNCFQPAEYVSPVTMVGLSAGFHSDSSNDMTLFPPNSRDWWNVTIIESMDTPTITNTYFVVAVTANIILTPAIEDTARPSALFHTSQFRIVWTVKQSKVCPE